METPGFLDFVTMNCTPLDNSFRPHLHTAVLILLLFTGISALGAPQEPRLKGMLRTETTNRPAMEVPFWVSADQLRMDITEPMKMSVVWSFGTQPSMLMIRQEEQVYVEWGPSQLENARQMVQQANHRAAAVDDGPLKFEPTGVRAPLEGWDAFEVRPSPKDTGSRLWLTADADYGLAEFFAHYALALQKTTQFPMFATENDPLGLTQGTSLPLAQLSSATGLEGRVVRIVDKSDIGRPDKATTITLHSIEPGPFPEDVFSVPDGYLRKAQLSSGAH